MSIDLTTNEVQACRAFSRLLAVHTEGWLEAEGCDSHYDGGEWSGPAWADNWQEAEEHCYRLIADRFDLPSPEYVMHLTLASENEEQHRFWKAQHVKYVIWGSMTDDKSDAQEITTLSSRRAAELYVDRINNADPNAHPDLCYWFETVDERPLTPIPYGDTPADLSGHSAICKEYHDRGLDCRCIPEGVKDAIRKGANPEEVM